MQGQGRRGLSPRIVKLFEAGVHKSKIAEMVGCSHANVGGIIRRRGLKVGEVSSPFLTKLEPRYMEYLQRTAKRRQIGVTALAARMLRDAIDSVIAEGRGEK